MRSRSLRTNPGIDAPRSVTVHRQEVAQAIESANREH
jgi:sRNA-binding carbon storage regulator CsrA